MCTVNLRRGPQLTVRLLCMNVLTLVVLSLGGVKTALSRRAESPTPTTDPDGSPSSSTVTGSQRKTPSRGRGEKVRKPQTSSRTSKRSTTSSATKIKK